MLEKSLRSAGLVLALALLGGCGGTPVLSEADLEKGASDQLTETVGQAPDDIDCPGDLEAEVDASIRCTLTSGPDELGMTITVTKVEGTQVDYEIEVDEE